jgi:cell division protease FtsH
MDRKARRNLIGFAVISVGILLAFNALRADGVRQVPYSEFVTLLDQGKVKEVLVTPNEIQGQTSGAKGGDFRFVTNRVDRELADALSRHHVKYAASAASGFITTLLSWVAPVLIFAALWIFILKRTARRMGPEGGFMSIGKSKAKIYVETDTRVSFKDVAGVDEAKEELREIVEFLKNRETYGRLGARMPKGVLLIGPPGTGKTLLARAVAGEAGVAFLSISGSEFVEMFVGVGAARVRDLFEQARHKVPCIIFIDELDALGGARAAQAGFPGHDEKGQTLNQLLSELDGFDPAVGIVLLGATNRPEVLDPALLRAGRFDRQILVDRPDKHGRLAILAVHVPRVTLAQDLNLEEVAALTPGFTGADLANLVNEAALAATRRGANEIGMQDFNSAIERIVAGLERKNRLLNANERLVVAHHEIGHALVATVLPGADVVHKISIIPRGIGALGYTIQRPTEDRYLMSRAELENKMAILLGGRAAEQLVFGHRSTGAADDLVKATDVARSMVTRYAMDTKLGHVAYETDPPGFLGNGPMRFLRRAYSEETAREIDCAVRDLLDQAFGRAYRILESNRQLVERGATLLLEKETLAVADLRVLFQDTQKEPASEASAPGREASVALPH